MIKAKDIVQIYISFFEARGHKRIENAPLVPRDDPTTLFTSSGMQSLLPYLLGKPHPLGRRLVNVQNCFRSQDIEEIGDNRHTTFFRMLGNWSLGDYFKKEQIPYFFEFLTQKLGLDPKRFYISVFEGLPSFSIPRDDESFEIWVGVLEKAGIDGKKRIFFGGVEDNWWSRAGTPDLMPEGEPGGPDTEVYYDFYPEEGEITKGNWKELSDAGRIIEIGNSVFMQYIKKGDRFENLPQKNVDFGGGLERLLASIEGKSDVFQTNLFLPIIKVIEKTTKSSYKEKAHNMRIITDHLIASCFIISAGVKPSNKEHGYVLRRLIRRSVDNLSQIGGKEFTPIIEAIVEQYKDTDPYLVENFELIKNVIEEEKERYNTVLRQAKAFVQRKYKLLGGEIQGVKEISSQDAFYLYTSLGLSPSQIKSLGFVFDDKEFAERIKEHKSISKASAKKKFGV